MRDRERKGKEGEGRRVANHLFTRLPRLSLRSNTYPDTGGDWAGNLHKLHDKTVAIIGTGATAVQSVPALAEHSKELYVFQRTPSTVNVRDNHPTDEAWIKSLKPGWQRERDRAFMMSPTGAVPTIDLDDGFTRTFLNLSLLNRLAAEGHPKAKDYSPAELMQLADFRHMEAIRRRVDEVVKDKETAEKLKPWCKLLFAFRLLTLSLADHPFGLELLLKQTTSCASVPDSTTNTSLRSIARRFI